MKRHTFNVLDLRKGLIKLETISIMKEKETDIVIKQKHLKLFEKWTPYRWHDCSHFMTKISLIHEEVKNF